MIKNVKIRILAFFMAVTLSFCVISSEYHEVNALEWAGTVVAFDTAIKAILGLLGVGVAVGTASQIDWGQLKDECVEYQIAQGTNSAQVGKWWNDVINGALDTGSECWTSFKEWVKEELLNSGSASSGSINGDLVDIVNNVFPNITSSNIDNFTFDRCYYYHSSTNSYTFRFYNSSSISVVNGSIKIDFSNGIRSNPISSSSDTITFSNIDGNTNTISASLNHECYLYNFNDIAFPNEYFIIWDIDDVVGVPTDSSFDSAISDLGAIGLAPDVATDLPYDGVIDIPWENVGATDTAIDDAFDDALDKVNTGTWTLDHYWTWVQNVTNVFAYDTTNNYLLPNDGDDEKADDKVQQNINRGAMVLYGLEKVFPFCIPWDIYAFVNLLVADPVAPVIEYPIYNPVSGEDEIITIDFSVWESQVILMRYIEDFLLIIGLLLLARSLIGAGGSD